MDLESLTVRIGADIAGLTAGISGAKLLLAGFGLAAIGVGAAAVKMGADFQSQMLTIKTGAGGVHENIAQLSQAVLGLSTATGTGTKGLVDGLFMIESSGQRGSQALSTLQMAAEGAKVGAANLGTVADATTTIMTDFSKSHITAAQAVNTLIATVANGKTHMEDLAQSLSSVLPTASAVGVSLTDTTAAMATMTGEGIPAANAATYLRQTLLALDNPAKKAQTTLKEIGLTSTQVSDAMKVSLPNALKLITDHLKTKFPEGSAAYVAALANIAGGTKTMQGLLDLTGTHLQTFKDNVNNISTAVQKGGNSINGWSDVQGTFNFKMDQAKAAVEGLMIKVGTALLPALGNLLGKITPVITAFGNWVTKSGVLQGAMNLLGNVFSGISTTVTTIINVGSGLVNFFKNNQVAADALQAVLLTVSGIALAFAMTTIPTLVAGFITWATTAGAAAVTTMLAAAPIILIGVLIAALITGIILLVQHWKDVEKFALMIWGHIRQFFEDDVVKPIGSLFNNLGTNVHNILQGIGNFFSGLGSTVKNVIKGIGDAFSGLGSLVHGIWNGIVGAIKGAINFVIGLINNVIGAIDNIHVNTPFGSIGFSIPKIPLLEQGGIVPPGKAAIAGETGKPELVLGGTSGATVLGVNQTASLMARGGGQASTQPPIHVHIHNYIDGREMTNTMMLRTISEIRSSSHPIGEVA